MAHTKKPIQPKVNIHCLQADPQDVNVKKKVDSVGGPTLNQHASLQWPCWNCFATREKVLRHNQQSCKLGMSSDHPQSASQHALEAQYLMLSREVGEMVWR